MKGRKKSFRKLSAEERLAIIKEKAKNRSLNHHKEKRRNHKRKEVN